MGIFNAWRVGNATSGILTPYNDASHLLPFVTGDLFEGIELPIGRAEAMQVPAVAKARNLIAPTVGRQPLVALDANGRLPDERQPSWTYRTDQDLTSVQWMWTMVVDDLIFLGASLLGVKRGSDGFPISMERIDPSRWTITDGNILVDEKPVESKSVIFIPGVVDALLVAGQKSIRQAIDIELGVAIRAAVPNPQVVLRQTDPNVDLEQGEAQGIVTEFNKNRRSKGGSTTFLPSGLDLEVLGQPDTDFSIQARNAMRNDIGGFLGIPASVMDASLATASLTYSTAEGNRNMFYDQAIPLYSGPIEHRLSLDDVVPRGQRIRFDMTALYAALPNPTGTPTED